MLKLAIETTTNFGSLSLVENDKIIDTVSWSKAKSHSQVITSNFLELLAQTEKNKDDLKELFIDIGPGSFTGNRIGLNFCAAISYGLSIPIQTKNSLEILAAQLIKNEPNKNIICMQNAFNQKIYTATYKIENNQLQEVTAPMVCSPTSLDIQSHSYALGNGFDLYKALIPKNSMTFLSSFKGCDHHPKSKDLAHLCLNQSSGKIAWNQLEPLYLKASEAEEKLKRGELKKALSGQYS